MMTYNPHDWYWVVGNDTNRYWSSKAAAYVAKKPKGYGATKIDTEHNLSEVLAVYGLAGPVPIVPSSVPMWAVRTVLHNDGLFDRVQAIVTGSTDISLKNIWEYGNFADRNSAAIATLAAALDLTSEQVDQMFIDANNLSV